MGASALRSGALSDAGVIAYVNDTFVPVWIDVRESPLPRLEVWPHVLEGARLGPDNRIVDLFSQGFFLREVVLTPDAQTLLNAQADTRAGSVASMSEKGYYAYAQVKPQDVLGMLRGAELRYERLEARADAR